MQQPGINKVLATTLMALSGLIIATVSPAQTHVDAGQEETPEPVRRVQRLGDAIGENEWRPDLSPPPPAERSAQMPRLPDEMQQEQLTALLSALAANPADQSAQTQLEALLQDVLLQASAAIDAGEPGPAGALLDVIQAVSPGLSGYAATRTRLQALSQLKRRLEAARAAMESGRVDGPGDDSALFLYRQIADEFPANDEARAGLLNVQQDMLSRAIRHAVDADFDAAERLLDSAATIIDEHGEWEQARAVITNIKAGNAELLETRAMQLMRAGDFSAAERVLIDLIALGGQERTVRQLRQRLEEARHYGGFETGQVIRDPFLNADFVTPELVVIPTGSYLIGSSSSEKGHADAEGPQQRVTFRRGFAIGLHEVSVAEFSEFVKGSGYRTDAERMGRSTVYDTFSGRLTEKSGVDWRLNFEGKPARPEDPVIHVSWNDAHAYVSWLANGTGKPYRLPSEAEFEYALRAGSNTQYWWGRGAPIRVVENITGERDSSGPRRVWAEAFPGYGDKYWGPAPVSSFEPNPFGLYDMGGNVSEWVGDCWHDNYVRAPVDGSAWINPGCDQRVIRGGHWASLPSQTRSAYRRYAAPDFHDPRVGIRIARDL